MALATGLTAAGAAVVVSVVIISGLKANRKGGTEGGAGKKGRKSIKSRHLLWWAILAGVLYSMAGTAFSAPAQITTQLHQNTASYGPAFVAGILIVVVLLFPVPPAVDVAAGLCIPSALTIAGGYFAMPVVTLASALSNWTH
jgi:hypothetical protein